MYFKSVSCAKLTSQVTWVPLNEMEQKAILAVVLTPQKRVCGKQMQPEMANAVTKVNDMQPEVPDREEHPREPEMAEKQEDGGEMVEKEEEAGDTEMAEDIEMMESDKELVPGKACSRGYRWREWSSCRARSFFKRNPRGDIKETINLQEACVRLVRSRKCWRNASPRIRSIGSVCCFPLEHLQQVNL